MDFLELWGSNASDRLIGSLVETLIISSVGKLVGGAIIMVIVVDLTFVIIDCAIGPLRCWMGCSVNHKFSTRFVEVVHYLIGRVFRIVYSLVKILRMLFVILGHENIHVVDLALCVVQNVLELLSLHEGTLVFDRVLLVVDVSMLSSSRYVISQLSHRRPTDIHVVVYFCCHQGVLEFVQMEYRELICS